MYDEVYDAMEECGVALKLDHPVFQDEKGSICDERSSFGLKITHNTIHPEMYRVVDEVGSNLSHNWDGHIVGKKMCVEEAQFPNAKFSTGKIILPHWGLQHWWALDLDWKSHF